MIFIRTPKSPPSAIKPRVELLDPSNPELKPSAVATADKTADPASADLDINAPPGNNDVTGGGWRFGTKRILRSVVSVCQRVNQLILKVVAKIFPWNRRAKRRLKGEEEE